MTKTTCTLDNPQLSSSTLTISGVKYSIERIPFKDGGGGVFSVEEPGKEPERLSLTGNELKALYYLLTTKK